MKAHKHTDASIESIRKLPGLQVQKDLDARFGQATIEGTLEISSHVGTSTYAFKTRRTVTTTTLPAVIAHLDVIREKTRLPPLLLTPYVTRTVGERLMAEGVEFADAVGNVYLNGEAAFVAIMGNKADSAESSTELTFASLVVVFALLSEKKLRRATYREISRTTSISLGKISQTIKQLEAAGYLVRVGDGTLQTPDFRMLLQRWEIGYLEVVRPRLSVTHWKMPPNTTPEALMADLDQFGDCIVGGELAADKYTGRLRPSSLTIHVPAGGIRKVAAGLRLSPREAHFDVTMMDRLAPPLDQHRPRTLSSDDDHLRLANPILTRAELLASGDDRLREVANRLLEDVILEREAHAAE
jgi:hypothetical protein